MLALGATAVRAQPPPTAAPARKRPAPRPSPWHKGVSTENKTKALALYNVGNTFFAKSQWSAALVKYAAAVKLWDHPGIRYNMAKCLMEQKRYLEAHHSLKLALRFGAAPLDPPRLFKEGRFLLGVLERLLARVRIVCPQAGVRVTLDGQLLFVGPGEKTRLMDPTQRHVVEATLTRHITLTRALAPLPGRLTVVTLRLMKLKKTLVMKRRWARWIGWTVLAAGVALAGGGVPLLVDGNRSIAAYDDRFNLWCTNAAGCLLSERPRELVKLWNRSVVNQALGAVFIVLGSAAITTGMTLIFLNVPRAISPEGAPRPKSQRITLVPAIHRGGGSVTLAIRF